MVQLTAAALFFLGIHFGIAGTPMRSRAVALLGEKVYRGIFSTLSLLGLFWLGHAYRGAEYIETWGQLTALKPVAAALMLLAFLLAVLGLATPNPTAVGGERLLEQDVPAQGVMRFTRHPFLWGVATWAAVHTLVNGDLASLILFGSLLLLVLRGMVSIDRKRRLALGEHWERFAAATSIIPFQAILQGRNRLVWAEFRWWHLLAAFLAYGAVMHFHKALFGVSPLF